MQQSRESDMNSPAWARTTTPRRNLASRPPIMTERLRQFVGGVNKQGEIPLMRCRVPARVVVGGKRVFQSGYAHRPSVNGPEDVERVLIPVVRVHRVPGARIGLSWTRKSCNVDNQRKCVTTGHKTSRWPLGTHLPHYLRGLGCTGKIANIVF